MKKSAALEPINISVAMNLSVPLYDPPVKLNPFALLVAPTGT